MYRSIKLVRMLLLALVACLAIAGCGESGSTRPNPSPSPTVTPSPVKTSEVAFTFTLAQARADVPIDVVEYTFTGYDTDGERVYGPVSVDKDALTGTLGQTQTITLDLPISTTRVVVEFLNNAGIVIAESTINGLQLTDGGSVDVPVDTITEVKADWLFINYVASDNNLLPYQLDNVNAMQKVGSNSSVVVTAFVDVSDLSKGYLADTGWEGKVNWNGGRLFLLTKSDADYEINSQVLEEYGEVNSGDKATLQEVIEDSLAACPAKNVCVIMNDHGGAYIGACQDENYDGIMSVPDIKAGILAATDDAGVDLLAIDACLMSNLETLYELRSCADYLVASSESIWAEGFNYNTTDNGSIFGAKGAAKKAGSSAIADCLARMANPKESRLVTGDMTTKQVAQLMVSANKLRQDEGALLCAAIDTTKLADLAAKVDALAVILSESDAAGQIDFANAVVDASQHYVLDVPAEYEADNMFVQTGVFYDPTCVATGNTVVAECSTDYLYDLYALAECVAGETPTTDLELAAQDVITAMDTLLPADCYYANPDPQVMDVIGSYVMLGNYADCHGISICLPTKLYDTESAWEGSGYGAAYKGLEFYTDHPIWIDTVKLVELPT